MRRAANAGKYRADGLVVRSPGNKARIIKTFKNPIRRFVFLCYTITWILIPGTRRKAGTRHLIGLTVARISRSTSSDAWRHIGRDFMPQKTL